MLHFVCHRLRKTLRKYNHRFYPPPTLGAGAPLHHGWPDLFPLVFEVNPFFFRMSSICRKFVSYQPLNVYRTTSLSCSRTASLFNFKDEMLQFFCLEGILQLSNERILELSTTRISSKRVDAPSRPALRGACVEVKRTRPDCS